jgi:hypothetical protein
MVVFVVEQSSCHPELGEGLPGYVLIFNICFFLIKASPGSA